MNIYASYNWIKEYLDTKDTAEEFARKITMSGSEVEELINEAERFEKMVVGEVEELKAHPNADKLQIAVTDIGKKKVEIVCGGVNLREGMLVSVALPGSRVRWHGEEGWTELSETEVRGVKSHGMICAAEELGLDKMQLGEKDIWDITDLTSSKAGTALAEALGFNDYILNTEIVTNRVDTMSIIGLAREGYVVTGDDFEIKSATATQVPKSAKELKVEVAEKDLCPRYQAIVIDGVKVGPSPWWLQKRLLSAGHRPINLIVDITNYVLHEYGQPMHAFDYDKLEGKKIVVRKAKKGEKILALDGEEYGLSSDNLVIADGQRPVAVAGVMGGEETGVTESTKTIVFECATFDPVSVRRTSRELNLLSDSQLLFEKGLSTESTSAALMRAVELTLDLAGGNVASKGFDVRKGAYKPLKFSFDPEKAQALIGIPIKETEMIKTLKALGFEAKKKDDLYEVEVPYWRDHDIEASVDLVEEVARVYGYDNLPSELPSGKLPDELPLPSFAWERFVKNTLKAAGASEVYSYSFTSREDLKKYNVDPADVVRVANVLSSEWEYFRTSLVPSMLNTIKLNQRNYPDEVLFELARVFAKRKNDQPDEPTRLLMAAYGSDGEKAFLRAKGMLEYLFCQGGINNWELARGENDSHWHSSRSAKIMIGKDQVGMIGETSRELASRFDLEPRVSLVDIDFELLLNHLTDLKCYTQPAEFPSVKRDLAFVLKKDVEYQEVREAIKGIDELISSVEVFDVYTGKGMKDDEKSLAVHLEFQAEDRTLSGDEIDKLVEKIIQMLKKSFSA
ncbi:MAG: phenylalanine--tRNA ligase subunit beta, partial [Candidatus Uhrbacteria bacterium]